MENSSVMPNQIFCEIDDKLINLLKPFAKGRTVLDVGAGVGLLGSKMKGVIGIDIMMRESPLSPITIMAVDMWPFDKMKTIPFFIRPCHNGFPGKTLANNIEYIADAIYISSPENFEYDLAEYIKVMGGDSENLTYDILDWEGKDGEKAYHIIVNKKLYNNLPKMIKYHRVTFNHFDYRGEAASGWYTRESFPYDNNRDCWKNLSGGMCPCSEDDIVYEEAEAENSSKLDWSNTYMGLLEEDKYNGWLSPVGKFVQSAYESHLDTAEYIIKECSIELENKGWIKLQRAGRKGLGYAYYECDRITRAQFKFLSKLDLENPVDEEDCRF